MNKQHFVNTYAVHPDGSQEYGFFNDLRKLGIPVFVEVCVTDKPAFTHNETTVSVRVADSMTWGDYMDARSEAVDFAWSRAK
jgi:predicted aconitase